MIHIRRATGADIVDISRLCGHLGYPADEQTVRERFVAIEIDPWHAVFVAENEEGRVTGWIHVMPKTMLLSSDIGELGGLVVDWAERRKGTAKALVAHAEEWARENGYRELVVRSNVRRSEAHQFYPALGFEPVKEQKVYTKCLS